MASGDAASDIEVQKPAESHIEALRREQETIDFDEAMNARINRKFDVRILPWLFGIW